MQALLRCYCCIEALTAGGAGGAGRPLFARWRFGQAHKTDRSDRSDGGSAAGERAGEELQLLQLLELQEQPRDERSRDSPNPLLLHYSTASAYDEAASEWQQQQQQQQQPQQPCDACGPSDHPQPSCVEPRSERSESWSVRQHKLPCVFREAAQRRGVEGGGAGGGGGDGSAQANMTSTSTSTSMSMTMYKAPSFYTKLRDTSEPLDFAVVDEYLSVGREEEVAEARRDYVRPTRGQPCEHGDADSLSVSDDDDDMFRDTRDTTDTRPSPPHQGFRGRDKQEEEEEEEQEAPNAIGWDSGISRMRLSDERTDRQCDYMSNCRHMPYLTAPHGHTHDALNVASRRFKCVSSGVSGSSGINDEQQVRRRPGLQPLQPLQPLRPHCFPHTTIYLAAAYSYTYVRPHTRMCMLGLILLYVLHVSAGAPRGPRPATGPPPLRFGTAALYSCLRPFCLYLSSPSVYVSYMCPFL
jgi:hypothetical protein